MDRPATSNASTPAERRLAHLKILSRLLAHELRAQTGSRITLSREEVAEVQTSLDLFIEDALRRKGSTLSADRGEVEVQSVAARVN